MSNYNSIINGYSTSDMPLTINNINNLLDVFTNYLDTIELGKDQLERLLKKSNNIFNDIIQKLSSYMNIIINYYSKNTVDFLENNIDINYKFIDVMTKAILILYIYLFFKNIEPDSKPFEGNFIDTSLTFIMKKILSDNYDDIDVPDSKKLFFKFKDIIYTNNQKEITKINKKISCFSFLSKPKIIITDSELIIGYINKIRDYYHIKPSTSRYVTIPKYTGICWFMSFIIGICYSDNSKQLLIDKQSNNLSKYKFGFNNEVLSPEEILTTLVYTIINNITSKKLTYDDINKDKLNDLNIYIKETPIQFLIKLLNDFIDNKEKYTRHEYTYLANTIMKNSYRKISLDDYDKLGNIGIAPEEYYFLNILYSFLNITSVYIVTHKETFYKYNNEDTRIPDVLLVQPSKSDYKIALHTAINKKMNGENIIYDDITSNIKYNDSMITYNGNIYELDYIIYGSSIYNSWNNTGHAIIALQYYNDEYFYDSRYYIDEVSHKGIDIRYPCPLIKQKWKTEYNKNSDHFCLNKCFYSKINTSTSLSRHTKDLTEEQICYKTDDDIICGYVKVKLSEDPISTTRGGNIKLTSTNKKLIFFMNNNKIKRTIYINNDGIKFIKYNGKLIKIMNKY